MIRFYDSTQVSELERAAGLAEGTTAEVAFSPEMDTPLLVGAISKQEWVESIVVRLAVQVPAATARELATALAESPFSADDAVVTLLRQVRALLPLVLVTNANVELDDDLAVMGLTDLAHHVVNSAQVGVAKPDPKIYEIAAERASVTFERCLFVDDRLENIYAAVALGMAGVQYREVADLRGVLGSLVAD